MSQIPSLDASGHMVRLCADRSYGFMATDLHREVSLHTNAVPGMPCDTLQVNTMVDLDIEAGH